MRPPNRRLIVRSAAARAVRLLLLLLLLLAPPAARGRGAPAPPGTRPILPPVRLAPESLLAQTAATVGARLDQPASSGPGPPLQRLLLLHLLLLRLLLRVRPLPQLREAEGLASSSGPEPSLQRRLVLLLLLLGPLLLQLPLRVRLLPRLPRRLAPQPR